MSRSADTPGSSARRPREDGNATRQKIIEVAGTLFAEKGYAETSSKEITERAGTNIAAVNYHFGSREKLYIAVLDEVDHRSLEEVPRLSGVITTGESLARAFWRLLVPALPSGALARVAVVETAKNRFEYAGEDR